MFKSGCFVSECFFVLFFLSLPLPPSPVLFSSAHSVLVLKKHVFLEQHLLQPGCPHEPACGLLLPARGGPQR